MMIQEQGIEEYKFIKGDYASIKIKMQPKSLVLDIPLDWEINKIKCLLVRMIPKLQFDMFVFKHDNEELDGNNVLRQLIELDIDEQCINSEYYILTFKKLNSKKFQFQKYYAKKMKSLVKSLQNSPFQPILHPGYYSMKFLSHLNQFPLEGGRDLISNFNQLQQLQNIVQQHRRQNQNNEQVVQAAQGNNRVGILQWVRFGFFRIIQVVSLCTILNMIIKYSDMESFIIVAIVVIIYFVIGHLKNKKKRKDKQEENQPITQPQKQNEQIQQASFIEKIYFIASIFIVSKLCLIVETLITFIISIFPNWDVQFHHQFFKNTNDAIQYKLNKWNRKIAPIQPKLVPQKVEKLVEQPQKIAQLKPIEVPQKQKVQPIKPQVPEVKNLSQQKQHKQ